MSKTSYTIHKDLETAKSIHPGADFMWYNERSGVVHRLTSRRAGRTRMGGFIRTAEVNAAGLRVSRAFEARQKRSTR